MKSLIFATAVFVLLLALFAQSSLAEESYVKTYISKLQELSADVLTKASDTFADVKKSEFGQKVESWFDLGTGYISSAYDSVVDTAKAKWDEITS